ncbi:MAG: hypothetical protein OES37_04180 [Chromatiales bacterium]|jgi:hypothetical protein|nr:hypothetical protein [Chromatiales bacterium]
MNGERHTETEVLDEELLKEIIDGEPPKEPDDGRVVRLDPDEKQKTESGDGGSTSDR